MNLSDESKYELEFECEWTEEMEDEDGTFTSGRIKKTTLTYYLPKKLTDLTGESGDELKR